MMPGLKHAPFWMFLLLLLTFFLIELPGLSHIDPGDEHTYIYMGKLVAEGKMPYRDFFNSHPPVQVFVSGILFSLFGFSIVIFKLVPFFSTIGTSVLLFFLIKKLFGPWEGLLGAGLFLFSYRVMLEATYFLGVDLTTFFVVLSLFLLYSKRPLWAGSIAGVAALTGLYSLVVIFAVLAFLFFKSKKLFLRYSIGFFIVGGLINLALLLVPGYFLQVYWYHALKPSLPGSTFSIFLAFMQKHYLILSLALLAAFGCRRKRLLLPFIIAFFYLIFLLWVRLFHFYFVLWLPFLAMLAAVGLMDILSRFPKYRDIFIAIFLIFFGYSIVSTAIYLQSFDFIDFASERELTGFIMDNASPQDRIFGDVLTVPLLALRTEVPIAFDFVDTNAMRFLSGLADFGEVLKKLKEEKVRFVVVRPLEGFGNSAIVRDFLVESCLQSYRVTDPYWGDVFVYDCSKQPSLNS